MASDEEYMRKAVDATLEGIKDGQTPFGACIVRDGEVVCCTHNTVWGSCDSTAHAEVNAIRCACEKLGTIDLGDCVIYTTTEPCPMCFSACHWAKIKRIVYGASIGDAKDAGFRELSISNEKMREDGGLSIEVLGGVLEDECRELFSIWKASGKSKTY